MAYTMPTELSYLKQWLSERGVDVEALSTERQCAFFALKLSDQRIKFPPAGQSLFPVLRRIQDIISGNSKSGRPIPKMHALDIEDVRLPGASSKPAAIKSQPQEQPPLKPVAEPGLAIFCDGACEPNPGAGGWGYAVYMDGSEVDSGFGGLVETTNNQMELTGLLMALAWLEANRATEPALILCDSMYVVDGINKWVPSWKAKGWRRKGEKASEKNGQIANLELWKVIEAAKSRLPNVSIGWVKGHAGYLGNERADELSFMGREAALESLPRSQIEQQLDYSARIGDA